MAREGVAQPDNAADSDLVKRALAVQNALMDADRTMLQIITTALSMISIGVSIYAFFTQVAQRDAVDDLMARRMGVALLALGLLVLVTGLVSQMAYRFKLIGQHRTLRRLAGATTPPVSYRTQPTFVIAALLLAIGLLAFATIVGQQLIGPLI